VIAPVRIILGSLSVPEKARIVTEFPASTRRRPCTSPAKLLPRYAAHLSTARYTALMTGPARRLLQDALDLPEDERLELASEIIASVDGPRDGDWESTWLAELDRRAEAAKARGHTASDWTDVRARLLRRLGRT